MLLPHTHVVACKAGASKNIADKHGLTPLEPSVCAVFNKSAQRCTQRNSTSCRTHSGFGIDRFVFVRQDHLQSLIMIGCEELAQRRNKVSI
jgi:hypothetical protein